MNRLTVLLCYTLVVGAATYAQAATAHGLSGYSVRAAVFSGDPHVSNVRIDWPDVRLQPVLIKPSIYSPEGYFASQKPGSTLLFTSSIRGDDEQAAAFVPSVTVRWSLLSDDGAAPHAYEATVPAQSFADNKFLYSNLLLTIESSQVSAELQEPVADEESALGKAWRCLGSSLSASGICPKKVHLALRQLGAYQGHEAMR